MTDATGQSAKAIELIANTVRRSIGSMFSGYFQTDTKRDHYPDYGYPKDLNFTQCWQMYRRNGMARAGVNRTASKTWQDFPFLRETADTHDETALEKDTRERLEELRFWQLLCEADKRGMVGRYAGVILRLADSKQFNEPVELVNGGLMGLVEIIPAWEGQLEVASWDDDQRSETYGQPTMYRFVEQGLGNVSSKGRSFDVHPDRVVIWSENGSVHGESLLEPGYNDLLIMEKVAGAGGEGFWKTARNSLVINLAKESKFDDLAKAMGVPLDELGEKLNEVVDDYQKGFDKAFMGQGMDVKALPVALPSPEHFFAIGLQGFAASISIPLKILVGSQSGERASTEDASEWAQTCQSRRKMSVIPNIMQVVRRLVRFGVLNERLVHLDWSDLTEMTMDQKIERANKMADVNQKLAPAEGAFTPDEIRDVVDLEPIDPIDDPNSPDDDPEDAE